MSTQQNWHFLDSVPENYERYLVPSIFAPWAADLVESATLLPGERVLDVACGTGIVARFAARKLGNTGSVTGLDLSAPMLAVARAAATAEGLVVEWREGSAGELPFSDAVFDVVFCQQSFQFFPDKPSALREINRVLRPSGRLVLSVWGPIERSPGFAVLTEALTHHVSPAAGLLLASGPFGLGDAEELRALIAGAGFKDISVRPAVKTLRYPYPTSSCSVTSPVRRWRAQSATRTRERVPRFLPRSVRNCHPRLTAAALASRSRPTSRLLAAESVIVAELCGIFTCPGFRGWRQAMTGTGMRTRSRGEG